MSPVAVALGLTVLAGAATSLGALLAVRPRWRADAGLAVALAFAAGAMVLVSVVQVLPAGVAGLTPALGRTGALAATLGVAALAAVVVAVLTRPRHDHRPSAGGTGSVGRSGLAVAAVVAAHNVPEGMATFVAALDDPAVGAVLALAIAVHNVPEGIAVAAPVTAATGSPTRGVVVATLSGLAEPVGAVLGYLLLVTVLPAAAFALVFGLVAGVMIRVGLADLVPAARRLATRARTATAFLAGGAAVASSLVLLRLA